VGMCRVNSGFDVCCQELDKTNTLLSSTSERTERMIVQILHIKACTCHKEKKLCKYIVMSSISYRLLSVHNTISCFF